MLEVIDQVKKAEQQAQDIRAQSNAKARQIGVQAQKDGQDTLEQTRKIAQEQAEKMLADARAAAANLLEQEKTSAARQAQELLSQVDGKLDAAAALIIERIVDSV